MQVLIDADGCPVVDIAVRLAQPYGAACLILCDTAHHIQRPGAQTLVFDQGADSVDFALVNRVHPGDVVITQDYGLAAMCLAKNAYVLDQNGMRYTSENMNGLLDARHRAKVLRRSGAHLRGPKKRTAAQNDAFAAAFTALLQQYASSAPQKP